MQDKGKYEKRIYFVIYLTVIYPSQFPGFYVVL